MAYEGLTQSESNIVDVLVYINPGLTRLKDGSIISGDPTNPVKVWGDAGEFLNTNLHARGFIDRMLGRDGECPKSLPYISGFRQGEKTMTALGCREPILEELNKSLYDAIMDNDEQGSVLSTENILSI